jgi:hypothetical protein
MADNATSGGTGGNGGTGSSNNNGLSPMLLFFIALGLILVYLVILWLLFRSADDQGANETVWGRYMFLLGGLEAVVFTAVGWLFGREVNRKQAEQAEQATQEAADAKAKGSQLRGAILGQPTTGEEAVSGGGGLARLRQLAQDTTF